jgi:hypothetical protein
MSKHGALMCIAGLVLATGASSFADEDTMPGGYRSASVTNREVIAAAKYAVTAQEKTMQDKKNPKPAKLKLVKILKAHQQVVAGMNFRLKLKVSLNGKDRDAEVVVWWQAWRKPDPYRLTSWHWKEDKEQNRPDASDGK